MASPGLDDHPTDFLSQKKAEKTKTAMSKEIFEDFQRFLKTENKNLESLSKAEVKQVYSEEYKLYRSQIAPEQPLPTFYKLFRVLFQQNVAHFEDDKICLGPLDGKQSKKSRGRGKGRSLENSPSHTSKNSVSLSRPGRQMVNRYKMAVDQHLTFKTGSIQVIDQPDFRGDVELWRHISKTNSQSNNIFYCGVCQSKCNSAIDMDQHVNGRRHRLANTLRVLKSKKYVKISSFHSY